MALWIFSSKLIIKEKTENFCYVIVGNSVRHMGKIENEVKIVGEYANYTMVWLFGFNGYENSE